MRIVVTGYAGFIGSNLTRMLLNDDDIILGIDNHTYAARPLWVWEKMRDADSRFMECKLDIRDYHKLAAVLEDFKPDQVYHLAAESHVCRSIEGPEKFATTNFMGTFNLLEALRNMNFKGRLVHVSTDEAFGELRLSDEPFCEMTPLKPTSPYSASKAASDLMVQAYVRTYGLNAVITRCSNNFGPNQHQEKLIPRTITRLMHGLPVILHGDGSHRRDWIYVDDHCRALQLVMNKGLMGHVYCVGSGMEMTNYDMVMLIGEVMGITPQIEYRNDRPTDDARYAVNVGKLTDLGWVYNWGPLYVRSSLQQTVIWYEAQK